jgi:ATP diphosphatase
MEVSQAMQTQYTQPCGNAAKMLSMDATSKSIADQATSAEPSAQNSSSLEQKFLQAVAIMAQLRAPGGCPWDREQTFDSIRRFTLEETYEVLDAIERRDWQGLKDELGDLLLQVLFYAEMAQEAGYFRLQDVIENLNAKLIRRHPHVFADRAGVENSDQVLANWEEIKKQERAHREAARSTSLLDAITRGLPALMESSKLGSKAASVGFDWTSAPPVFDKLSEELEELRAAIAENNSAAQEEELGDVLFTVVNLARKLGLQAELALRASNAKFRQRFRQMESLTENEPLEDLSSGQLEELWLAAKARERGTSGDFKP